MARVFSGIKPTGHMQLGNYLGAVRRWAAEQDADGLYCVVDLHAFTVEHEPRRARDLTREIYTLLLACGLDPDVGAEGAGPRQGVGSSTVFVQSDVPAHTELGYLMECTATYGELRRMVQFKEKAAGQESVRLSLLTYPTLMAADILLYDTDEVPVGDDQRQHVELTRDLAGRFNARYGPVFRLPRPTLPTVTARVMDLQDPTAKMGKSNGAGPGVVFVLDPPDVIARKVRRAVTDAETEVRYDPAAKPGVSNLLAILSALTRRAPGELAGEFTSYGGLKDAVADAVIGELVPVQERYRSLAADRQEVDAARRRGAERARVLAAPALQRAREAIGLD